MQGLIGLFDVKSAIFFLDTILHLDPLLLFQLLLMSWSIQLLRLLKREQRKVFDTKEYKKQERQKLLLHNEGGSGNGGENGQELSNAIQTSGVIKESKSVENFQSAFPPPPIRSTSRYLIQLHKVFFSYKT